MQFFLFFRLNWYFQVCQNIIEIFGRIFVSCVLYFGPKLTLVILKLSVDFETVLASNCLRIVKFLIDFTSARGRDWVVTILT